MHFLSKKIRKYTSLITNIKLVYQIVGIIQLKLIQTRCIYTYIHLNKAKWRLFFNTRMPRIIPRITFNPRVVNRR